MVARPALAGVRPTMTRMLVDLPAPFGPRNPVTRPGNAEIAGELYLSVPPVKAHVSRLFDKLDSTNRVQSAMVVHDAGLV